MLGEDIVLIFSKEIVVQVSFRVLWRLSNPYQCFLIHDYISKWIDLAVLKTELNINALLVYIITNNLFDYNW